MSAPAPVIITVLPWDFAMALLPESMVYQLEWLHPKPGAPYASAALTGGPMCGLWIAVARRGKRPVAAFRFGYRQKRRNLHRMAAFGTYVVRRERNTGLGTKLWRTALEMFHPNEVYVETISRGGTAMVTRLKEEFPDIAWEHDAAVPGVRRLGVEAVAA